MTSLLKIVIAGCLVILTVGATSAQQGTIKESLKLKSAILGKDVEYSLYLPPDYDQSNPQAFVGVLHQRTTSILDPNSKPSLVFFTNEQPALFLIPNFF